MDWGIECEWEDGRWLSGGRQVVGGRWWGRGFSTL